jgi:Tfp pilus assembly protein PilO
MTICDYHNLAIFFDKVARLSCIVNINNININRGKDARDLNTSCMAVTAVVEPSPGAPARQAGGQAGGQTRSGKT